MAFCQDKELQSITLPEALETLENSCFAFCNLRNVEIPGSVMEIGRNAFMKNEGLLKVRLAIGVRNIGEGAFYGCLSMVQAQLPESLEKIDRWGFKDCKNLKRIIIPASVKQIGTCAFEGCTALEDVTLLSADTMIKKGAFKNCPDEVEKLSELPEPPKKNDKESNTATDYGELTYYDELLAILNKRR